ncbi:carbohydrate ABC transporter permease [Jiangella aurantiaca]|uniref:Carbohydrate ABC transporter permease n=1 Tax=Jiangella aurantiaca TaxID=2530373 RepID=A0A4R5AFS0_9ACTN|nr:carbohydrate ABC transporter permease [Jiangella aurantiaca]TDD71241.1 carbohydrate ABC transporter permease [Jiangella aurantiaca]
MSATTTAGSTLTTTAGRVWRVVALALIVLFACGPIVWMVLSSFRPPAELFQKPPQVMPRGWTGRWYEEVFAGSDVLRWFANSFTVSVATTLIAVTIGTLAAYALTRFDFPGRRTLLGSLVVAYLFPAILLLVPVYLMLSVLGLVGNLSGLVVAHLATTLPLAIWLMKSFVESVPRELEEAALVDGCSQLRAFALITVPLLRTGLATTALFVFILSWDEYLFASVLTQGDTMTVPVAIAGYVTSFDIRWGAIMALGTLVTLPIVVIFSLLQRLFEKGITSGSVKG